MLGAAVVHLADAHVSDGAEEAHELAVAGIERCAVLGQTPLDGIEVGEALGVLAVVEKLAGEDEFGGALGFPVGCAGEARGEHFRATVVDDPGEIGEVDLFGELGEAGGHALGGVGGEIFGGGGCGLSRCLERARGWCGGGRDGLSAREVRCGLFAGGRRERERCGKQGGHNARDGCHGFLLAANCRTMRERAYRAKMIGCPVFRFVAERIG